MSSTSLNAYAAWLAKHETKAVRKRRSLSPETETELTDDAEAELVAANDIEASSTASRVVLDPYSQWLQQKETKLPLIKIVVQMPEGGAFDGSQSPESRQELNKKRSDQGDSSGQPHRLAETNTTTGVHSVAAGKRKRKSFDGREDTKKKAKNAATSAPPSLPLPSSTASTSKSSKRSRSELDDDTLPGPAPSTISRSQLPVYEEARYWRDVDRFSFLA